ncbi:unnamed protein product [Allacma fusca]|uniref:Uncharacterized protein n=1 Tax=Allacma fusca TaxID=39272 RepID=A0A8J2NPQ9_9HEXA|nr:unnamed protein product [Allacma fusca]
MITFETVSRHHAGIYECFAENEIGSARTAINLQILYPPEIETEAETVSTGQGFNADLVCLVHAEPKATVVWYKEGRKVDSDKHEAVERMSHKYILHVKGVTEMDFGDYQCVANNSLGRNNKNIFLSGTPSQPVIQSGKSGHGKDPHSYNLVWEFQSHSPADTCKLRYKKVGDDDWMEMELTSEGNSPHIYTASHTLQELTPSTDYVATLAAHNSHGWSKPAQNHEFHVNGNDIQSQEADTEPGAKAVESIVNKLFFVHCLKLELPALRHTTSFMQTPCAL